LLKITPTQQSALFSVTILISFRYLPFSRSC